MTRVDTVVIGAGHAGLAVSRLLTDRGRDHVVLERGRLAERWRSERWDSLTLLTPNWMSRLPGYRYTGGDPDGYMTADDLVGYLEGYARSFAAPVRPETTVLAVRARGEGYEVATDQGSWRAANVVLATGWCGRVVVPEPAAGLSAQIAQGTANAYKHPAQLPSGAVLVVGARNARWKASTSWSSAPAAPAPPPRSCSRARACRSSPSTARSTAATRSRPTP